VKTWGNLRAGKRLTVRRQALEDWRYDCWKRDYRFCSWGAVGVLSDPMLSKLASSVEIATFGDLLEAAADWGYVGKYGNEVLSLLKDVDCKQRCESQAQRVETMRANKKRKFDDLERDEMQQGTGGSMLYGPLPAPLSLTRTRIIDPVIVKQVPQPSRPRPKPRPILVSRPYTRTDAFDSLMNNSKGM